MTNPDRLKIDQEISTWTFLANTLNQDHQQGVKSEILLTIKKLKQKVCNHEWWSETDGTETCHKCGKYY